MKKNSSYISYKLINIPLRTTSKKINGFRPNSSLPQRKNIQKDLFQKENKDLNNSLLFTKRNYKLPPVPNANNLNNSTFDISSNNSSFLIPNNKKDQYNIEKEQLLEETMRYKIKLKKLKLELLQIKSENLKRQNEINLQDDTIEKLIKQNEDEVNSNQDNTLQEDLNKMAKINLRKKIKQQLKEINIQLNNEKLKKKDYEKDEKLTKKKEILIMNHIIENEMEKIYLLLNNSFEFQESQKKKLLEVETLKNNLINQNKLIECLELNYNESYQKELELQNKIEELKLKLLNQKNYINKINEKEENLKNLNSLLQKEKIDLFKNSKEDQKYSFSLSSFEKKISFLKSECLYFKTLSIRNEKEVSEAKKILDIKIDKIKSDENENRKKLSFYKTIKNETLKDSNLTNKENEEKIKKLKEIFDENKKKENELEQRVLIYQETLKKLNSNYEESNTFQNENTYNYDLGLNSNNPFYSNLPSNQPLQTKLFTNEQFNQFTYVLFKNFEAKKINIEIAKSEIIDKVFDSNDIISLDVIVKKFSERVSQLLNCKNKDDIIRMEIFFGALCYIKGGDAKKISEYFISLFSFIQDYNFDYEKKLINKIQNKYKDKFILIYESIINFVNQRGDTENNDYISLIEIKVILDNLPDLNIKDKYIEYIFYYMKKFDNPEKSLFDLKISKLKELLDEKSINSNTEDNKKENDNENINKNKQEDKEIENKKNNNFISLSNTEHKEFPKSADDKNKLDENDSYEEISREEYEKAINEVLLLIKLIMEKENKTCYNVFEDSIVKISQPECDIITIESFNDELVKRGINLTELQISCICNKYCINEKLKALNVPQIDLDIKKINIENDIKDDEDNNNDDLNGARLYDNDDDSNNSFDAIQSKRKYTS